MTAAMQSGGRYRKRKANHPADCSRLVALVKDQQRVRLDPRAHAKIPRSRSSPFLIAAVRTGNIVIRNLVLITTASTLLLVTPGAAQSNYAADRERMVETIEALARSRVGLGRSDALDPSVVAAMREVPRHELVPEDVRSAAYANRPLPIGYGQTISQPYIVALMTDLARPDKDDVILEVGTGSGYQAAVLSRLVDRVYSIEIVEPLARRAKEQLHRLGYQNITVRQGDGYYGWPEHAPFDAILVTAAASHIPPPLVGQLKPGGRMVIPVGPPFLAQNLMLVEKDPNGRVHTRVLLPVSFVPLTGSGSR